MSKSATLSAREMAAAPKPEAKNDAKPEAKRPPFAEFLPVVPSGDHWAVPRTQTTYRDKQNTSQLSRRVAVFAVPSAPGSPYYWRGAISIRWTEGENDVTPYLSLGNVGRGNPAIDTDDPIAAITLEHWKRDTLNAGIAWLEDRAKRGITADASAGTVKKIAAASLGFTLEAPKPGRKAKSAEGNPDDTDE